MNGATDRACAAAARVRKTVRATRRYASLTTAPRPGRRQPRYAHRPSPLPSSPASRPMKPPQPKQVPREPSGRSEAGDRDTPQLERIRRVAVHAAPDDDPGLVARIARQLQRRAVVVAVWVAHDGHGLSQERAQLLARRAELAQRVD